MKPSELPELEKRAEALNRHDVKWVLVGGMAVMLYGADYLTSECDLATEKTEQNLNRLKAALEGLGAKPVHASDNRDFEIDFSILIAPLMHLKTEAGPVCIINRLPTSSLSRSYMIILWWLMCRVFKSD